MQRIKFDFFSSQVRMKARDLSENIVEVTLPKSSSGTEVW